MWLAITIISLIAIGLVGYYQQRGYRQSYNNYEDQPQEATQEAQPADTPQDAAPAETVDNAALAMEILQSMGCQPKRLDNGDIEAKYQGENFYIESLGAFIRIWDPSWASFNLGDPNGAATQQAVNEANFNPGPTIVMTHPNSEGEVLLHSHWTVMLHPAIPKLDDYLAAVFGVFFNVKKQLAEDRQKIIEQTAKIAQN